MHPCIPDKRAIHRRRKQENKCGNVANAEVSPAVPQVVKRSCDESGDLVFSLYFGAPQLVVGGFGDMARLLFLLLGSPIQLFLLSVSQEEKQ